MSKHFAWVFLVAFLGSATATAAPLCEQQRGDAGKKPEASARRSPTVARRRSAALEVVAAPRHAARSSASPISRARRSTRSGSRRRQSCARSGTSSRSWKTRSPRPSRRTPPTSSIVAQQVEKVEKLRAENNATRTVMIYRMHLLLTPEQRVKVDEMRARMEAGAQASEPGARRQALTRGRSRPAGTRDRRFDRRTFHLEAVREQDRIIHYSLRRR